MLELLNGTRVLFKNSAVFVQCFELYLLKSMLYEFS